MSMSFDEKQEEQDDDDDNGEATSGKTRPLRGGGRNWRPRPVCASELKICPSQQLLLSPIGRPPKGIYKPPELPLPPQMLAPSILARLEEPHRR